MADMPRQRNLYVQKERTRHGTTVWYFRRGKEKRIRLPGAYGSKEFRDAYQRALAGLSVEPKKQAPTLTFRWLVDRFYQSPRYNALRPNTQRNYRLGLEYACRTAADAPIADVTKGELKEGLVKRENKPHAAMDYLKSLRAVFAFAVDSGWLEMNPALAVSVKRPKSDGYHTWTVEEVAQFQAKHAVGTQARLALDIMLYTGLRRGDAIILGRQHIKNGVITLKAGKNNADLTIPVLPPLAASIEATKTGDLMFLVNTRGRPWKNISFGYWFAARCEEAGVPGRAHGLRKAGATIAANNGATPFELTAMYGWSSTKVAEIYTKKADKARLAERAANKLYPHRSKGAGKR